MSRTVTAEFFHSSISFFQSTLQVGGAAARGAGGRARPRGASHGPHLGQELGEPAALAASDGAASKEMNILY